jgi:O-antigen/teichoic acid export membrane protein
VKGLAADLAAGSVVWTTLALGAIGAALLNLAYWLVPDIAAGVPPVLIRAYFWAMPPLLFLFVLSYIMYGLQRELAFGAIDVGWKAATLLTTVAVVGSAWNNIIAVSLLQLAVSVTSAVIGFVILLRTVGGRLVWRAATVREMFGYSTSVYAYNTIRYALGYGSMLLAGQLLSVADAGVFSVALMLGESVTLVAGSINLAFYPAVAVAEDPAKYAWAVTRRVMALCAAFGVALLAVSVWLVPRLYGRDFAPAVPLFATLLPGVVLLCGEQVLASFFAAAGRIRTAAVAVSIGALVLPLLAVALVDRADIYGLAVACTISAAAAAAAVFVGFARSHRHHRSRLA